MKTTISRRTLLAGAFATPAILTFPRGAQAATNLTLGHNAAPGNPRSIATERFAELVNLEICNTARRKIERGTGLPFGQNICCLVRSTQFAETFDQWDQLSFRMILRQELHRWEVATQSALIVERFAEELSRLLEFATASKELS